MFANRNITVYISIKYVSTNIKYKHKGTKYNTDNRSTNIKCTNIKYKHKIQIIEKEVQT